MSLSWEFLRAGAASAVILLTASCGFNNSVVSLDYRADSHRQAMGPRLVGAGHFTDARHQGEYNLGTVRSPIGTPMESISTRVPVENIVRNGFARGLSARGMLATLNTAPYLISGQILELQADQYIRPTAMVRVQVNLVRAMDGRVIFSQVFEGYHQGSAYIPGTGSPVPMLQDLASRALQDVIDQALDNRGLRHRIKLPGPSAPPPSREPQ